MRDPFPSSREPLFCISIHGLTSPIMQIRHCNSCPVKNLFAPYINHPLEKLHWFLTNKYLSDWFHVWSSESMKSFWVVSSSHVFWIFMISNTLNIVSCPVYPVLILFWFGYQQVNESEYLAYRPKWLVTFPLVDSWFLNKSNFLKYFCKLLN